jgi:hypothetical protein
MTEHTLKTTVPPPDGWRYQGEFRVPERGEYYLWQNMAIKCEVSGLAAHSILRRARWVPDEGEAYWMASGDATLERVYEATDKRTIQNREEGNIWRTWQQAAAYSKARKELAERMHEEVDR